MKMSILDALGYSLLGILIVFAALIILMFIIKIIAAVMGSGKKNSGSDSQAAPAAAPASAKPAELAPGSAGKIKLYNVSDKDAAMVMAIVADKLQKPLNELRFISIREVK